MNIDKKLAELICELEYTIGNQTYNPNSYNGWTGEEGCSFKYPVNYCVDETALENRKLTKTKSRIQYIDTECIKTMKYAFGSNHLYIGNGIVKVLEFLENRYGINFNELEDLRTKNRISMMKEFDSILENGDSVTIPMGQWEVGVDIPEGDYIVTNGSNREFGYMIIYVFDEKGNEINHIFTKDKKVSLQLRDGWLFKMLDVCILERE